MNTDPTVRLWQRPGGRWYARVIWDRKHETRKSLGTRNKTTAEKRFEGFVAEVLPGIISEREEGPPKPPSGPISPQLSALAEWFLETHLPYLRRAPKIQQHYRLVMTNSLAYFGGIRIAPSSRIVSPFR